MQYSPWNWSQIGIKLGTKREIPKASKFYVEKRLSMLQAEMSHLWHVNLSFTDQNRIQRMGPMKLNLEGLEMQEWNIRTNRAQKVYEKMGSFV